MPVPPQTVVVIPTYNEIEALPLLIKRLRRLHPALGVLVVDDNSPDKTGELADEIARLDPCVSVLHRKNKDGLGGAYLAAFSYLLSRGAGQIIQMDADGSHDPKDLDQLLAAAKDADMVIGSRWVAGGQIENWPRRRIWLSRTGSMYARKMLRLPIRDLTAGFRLWKVDALRQLDLEGINSRGYCFQVNMAWEAARRGLRVVEVPVRFRDRTAGKSKMNARIVLEALGRVSLWGIGLRLGRYRGK